MESKSKTSEKIKNGASYIMILLSSLGVVLSVVKYFTSDQASLTTSLLLFIVSVSILVKTLLPLIKAKKQ
jgi:sugar phosphate permease